jgi:hypothetical protein
MSQGVIGIPPLLGFCTTFCTFPHVNPAGVRAMLKVAYEKVAWTFHVDELTRASESRRSEKMPAENYVTFHGSTARPLSAQEMVSSEVDAVARENEVRAFEDDARIASMYRYAVESPRFNGCDYRVQEARPLPTFGDNAI